MPFFLLDFRSADVDGAVVPGRLTLASPTMNTLQQCESVVFLVHGFNVSRTDGAVELQALAVRLTAPGESAAVAVLWSGDSMVGALSYPFETNKANDSAVELAKFIGDSLPQRPRISFVAHSLGSRVVMETVRHLWIMNIPVDQVCLMAAAIDNDSLAAAAAYRAAALYAVRVTVLYSPSDHVLKFAYPAGNLLSAFLHWTATSDAALGYTGPRPASSPPSDIPAEVQPIAIPKADGVDHGDYLPGTNGMVNPKQQAAARFVNSVLAGTIPLAYS